MILRQELLCLSGSVIIFPIAHSLVFLKTGLFPNFLKNSTYNGFFRELEISKRRQSAVMASIIKSVNVRGFAPQRLI